MPGPINAAELLAEAEAALPQMLDDVRDLVETESPSSDHAAVALSAARVQALVQRRLEEHAEIVMLDGVSHVRRGSPGSRVLLLGHHDTVWPLGTLAEIPYAVQDGVMRGPGCFDMLVGVVQAVHAVALLRSRLDTVLLDQVEILVTGDEELGAPSSRELLMADATGCEAVLVLEASADGAAPKVARKGVSLYRLEVVGRAAHAGLEPEKGIHAGLALAHLTLAVSRLGDAGAGTTVTPTAMQAGTTSNTVPAAGQLSVDVRAWSAEEQTRVDEAIRALDLEALVPGARLVVHGGPDRPPLEPSASRDLLEAWDRAGAALGVAAIPGAAVGGASDGNFTAGIGVPTLDGLGAVGGGAHARDEHALVEPIARRTAQLALLVADLLVP